MPNDNYPMYFEPAYHCPKCNLNAIEAFDYYGNPMKLKQAAIMSFNGKEIPNTYFKRDVYRLRCRACGQTYQIRWYKGCPYPMSLDNKLIKIFLCNYSQKG